MYLLLTDRLTCPRCGPSFGLILLADRMTDRRVHNGTLGCPNCRDSFAVENGFADLRAPPRGPLPEGLAGSDPRRSGSVADDDESAEGESAEARLEPSDDVAKMTERLVALLGIHRGPGTVVLTGRASRYASDVAGRVDDLQTVAVDADTRHWSDVPMMSRMVAEPGLPFYSGTLRGAVVDGAGGSGVVFEGARVVAPRSRVVVLHAAADTVGVLEEAGLDVMAAESGTVVATRG